MIKIKNVRFCEHPVLGNLYLDFCDNEGRPVDTVLIAGENGTGKSTIMEALYLLVSKSPNHPFLEADIEYDVDGTPYLVKYRTKNVMDDPQLFAVTPSGKWHLIYSPEFEIELSSSAIYSDVDITFHANQVSHVTSMTLDEKAESRRSSSSLPTQIKQLIIDIQALDDADLSYAMRNNQSKSFNELGVAQRMDRFKNAFDRIFDDISYSRIETRNGHKDVLFSKNGVDVTIDQLSSGEKQVVYRGCFLLQDVNAMRGAFVFIDEPEISLHPSWQMRVMDYYKAIFTDGQGLQTSQIIAVTHSPFVIHNDVRRNDKVVVLCRDAGGSIQVRDKPEYYKCNSVEVVKDAFYINSFINAHSTVFLEGRTDELYFNAALQAYDISVVFQFKWVGFIDENGQEVNTGSSALTKAAQFLRGQELGNRNACLFDCDANVSEESQSNVLTLSLPKYSNSVHMDRGIENALALDSIDLKPFYTQKPQHGHYGENGVIEEFEKMKLCEYICSLSKLEQRVIFANLKPVIERLIDYFASS